MSFFSTVKKIIPTPLQKKLLPVYHYGLSFLGALRYGFPSRKMFVVGITGTKGKTTTVELVNSMFEEAGYNTAIVSTLRFKAGTSARPNLLKMTMPGRFFIQKMLREAVDAGCTHAIVEMTSEGAKQFRNKFIDLDAFILTNIAPEHIESHGSYENYVRAKLSIAEGLGRSKKPRTILIVNEESPEADRFLAVQATDKIPYGSQDAGRLGIETSLAGSFNLMNATAAAKLGEAMGISLETIRVGIKKCQGVAGRMQFITLPGTTLPYTVVVDYAHTPDSLKAVYSSFGDKRLLCVLGGTGGGRDKWKRPLMGEIADTHCSEIFLTDEDPYDENPREIVRAVAEGIKKNTPEIIMDRREAIARAIQKAQPDDVILITGKGTDPYIMGPRGTKTPWSDARIAEEELTKVLS